MTENVILPALSKRHTHVELLTLRCGHRSRGDVKMLEVTVTARMSKLYIPRLRLSKTDDNILHKHVSAGSEG